MTHIVLRKANKYIDVFFGQQGWNERQWSRFVTTNKDGMFALKHIKGAHVDNQTYSYVKQKAQELA
jgi:hypothetical protein